MAAVKYIVVVGVWILLMTIKQASPDPFKYNRLPSVMIALLARDAADFLPNSLACLAKLNYDKRRIALW